MVKLEGVFYDELELSKLHDPSSPFLIGNYMEGDKIHDVPQKSWIDRQLTLSL